MSGLLGQFEPDGLPGLLLPHRRPIDCIPVRCNILDLEGNDIAATQLAVDGQIEHRQVAGSPLDLQLGSDRPNVLWPQRWLCPNQLALVPGQALGAVGTAFSFLAWSYSSVTEDDQHASCIRKHQVVGHSIHGIDAAEKVVVRKQLRCSQVMAFFEALSSVPDRHGGLCYGALLGTRTDEARP